MKFLTLVNLTSGPDLDLRKSVLMVNSVLNYFLVYIPLFEVFSVNSGFATNDDPCELSESVIPRKSGICFPDTVYRDLNNVF